MLKWIFREEVNLSEAKLQQKKSQNWRLYLQQTQRQKWRFWRVNGSKGSTTFKIQIDPKEWGRIGSTNQPGQGKAQNNHFGHKPSHTTIENVDNCEISPKIPGNTADQNKNIARVNKRVWNRKFQVKLN